MYEIRDNKVVKVAESIAEVTSEAILLDIESLKTVMSDFEQTIEWLNKELEIVISLENKINQKNESISKNTKRQSKRNSTH